MFRDNSFIGGNALVACCGGWGLALERDRRFSLSRHDREGKIFSRCCAYLFRKPYEFAKDLDLKEALSLLNCVVLPFCRFFVSLSIIFIYINTALSITFFGEFREYMKVPRS